MCNVLVTSCLDGICRLWSETLLPEDSLLGGQISDSSSSSTSLPHPGGQKDKIQHALEVLASPTVIRTGLTIPHILYHKSTVEFYLQYVLVHV